MFNPVIGDTVQFMYNKKIKTDVVKNVTTRHKITWVSCMNHPYPIDVKNVVIIGIPTVCA